MPIYSRAAWMQAYSILSAAMRLGLVSGDTSMKASIRVHNKIRTYWG
jgi:hypothetical protein